MHTVIVPTPSGGITNDPRDPRTNVCRLCSNFDPLTDAERLLPYRSVESGDTSASTNRIANFIYSGGTLYGLGVGASPTFAPGVKQLSNFAASNAWSDYTPWSGSFGSARSAADLPAFGLYHRVFYGVRGARYVWAANPTNSSIDGVSAITVDASNCDLTAYSTVSNMIVHSKDDCLYLGYDNKIACKNASTWTAAALTLPAIFTITHIAEYGNFLKICCKSNVGGNSIAYLWDRDSSLSTVTESIDWGSGSLLFAKHVGSSILGIVQEIDANTLDYKTHIREWTGGPSVENVITFKGTALPVSSFDAHKRNNRLYFVASIPIGSTLYNGVWSIGRSSPGSRLAVVLEHTLNNDSSYTSPILHGCALINDFVFQAYQDDSDAWAMSKTISSSNASAYSSPSIWETTINVGMAAADRAKQKQLHMVGVSTEPLSSGQQVIVKYRVDGGAWKTVTTVTAVGATTTEQPFDANGDPFTAGREYEFHIESTGGAVVTGMMYKYAVLSTFL